MRRVFVSLNLPEPIRSQIRRVQTGLPKVRWVKPENLHLTLVFLGELGEPALDDAHSALSAIRAPRFVLELQGVGQFGKGNPRAVWTGVEASTPLLSLQEKIETSLRRAGQELDARKFKPHVTLARTKSLPPARIGRYMERFGLFATPPFTVDRFHLMESHLKPEGALYLPLADYPLS